MFSVLGFPEGKQACSPNGVGVQIDTYLLTVVLYSVLQKKSFQWLPMCVISLFYTSVLWKFAVVQNGNVDCLS